MIIFDYIKLKIFVKRFTVSLSIKHRMCRVKRTDFNLFHLHLEKKCVR